MIYDPITWLFWPISIICGSIFSTHGMRVFHSHNIVIWRISIIFGFIFSTHKIHWVCVFSTHNKIIWRIWIHLFPLTKYIGYVCPPAKPFDRSILTCHKMRSHVPCYTLFEHNIWITVQPNERKGQSEHVNHSSHK